MKRREFLTAATAGAGTILVGTASPATAEDRPDEKPLQIYKCQKCDTIVEVQHPGRSSLVHCGVPMKLLVEKTTDVGKEKHVPVIEKIDGGFHVKVGSIPHPMIEEHFIAAIQLIAGDRIYLAVLHPGAKPEATFQLDADKVRARAYCTIHGLWKSA